MSDAKYYGLILAGGRGTRFWPRSTKKHPKQVLNVAGERSLIQQTVDRLGPLIPAERIWVLTNDSVRDEIIRQLPEVPAAQIVSEPAQRNTAAAIGLAAHILHSIDPSAVFGVFPSDHVIGDAPRYLDLVRLAFNAADEGHIGVLGVKPRWAETGYGYIEFPKDARSGAVVPTLKFYEKPEQPQADVYFAAGNFFWNAGMFFWSAQTALSALRAHLPKTAAILSSLPAFHSPEFAGKLAEAFPLCQDISIDKAVMERAGNVMGVACDEFGWSDVGSWDAVHELFERDENGNASRSEILNLDSSGNYIDCGGKLVALLGVKDLIVVDTPGAILIADRKRAQRVSEFVKLLEDRSREELL